MDQQEIDRRVSQALEYHQATYNCAQCVACATADLVGVDHEQAFLSMEGFGGGMGGFTETCGALSGGVFVLSRGRCEGSQKLCSKKATYALCKELVAQFKKEVKDTAPTALCADLRPSEKELVMPTCNGYISTMVELTCRMLDEQGLIRS